MPETPLYQRIAEFTAPLALSLGLDVWGVEVALGPRSLVRVYVEKHGEDGVDIDACAELSRLLGLSLDVEDILEGAYTLEVSSPGLERVYFAEAQLAAALDNPLDVQLKSPLPSHPGRRRFRGVLGAFANGEFTLLAEEASLKPEESKEVRFTFEQVKKAHLIHIFPDKSPPGKLPAPKKAKAKPAATKSPRPATGKSAEADPSPEAAVEE
ncbi:ribosome maturation factor RimP [Desulfovibrio cuneatus]|uniref:ribosome maturation factor RimP n=1 Tax=Desulfovibrio cuneatus TaxID=159728 RepID=UPI0004048C7D|nr:ribosome maturation factor RimP [Desulfovibrio cuneatus]